MEQKQLQMHKEHASVVDRQILNLRILVKTTFQRHDLNAFYIALAALLAGMDPCNGFMQSC